MTTDVTQRIFFDTEFTSFRGGRLLSVGLVSESGRECYAELGLLPGEQVNDFVRTEVLSQFGQLPGTAARSLQDLGERVAAFLASFDAPLVLCFDYKLDRSFLEDALRRSTRWAKLEPRLDWRNVADELSAPAQRLASVLYLSRAAGPLRAHHALLDARALHSAWSSRDTAVDPWFARAWLYLGYDGPDARGRPLQAVVVASDDALEQVHDYIQWAFPLDEPSAFNNEAPVLDAQQLATIGADPRVQHRVLAAFDRMLSFYGLTRDAVDGRVHKAANWSQRGANWAFEPGHNDLRISRILRSLCLMGQRTAAQAFLVALEGIALEYRGPDRDGPMRFWRHALR